MINLKIKSKEEFSCFEINDFLKQLTSKEMIIENYLSINEIIPANILQFNKKYYLQNIKARNYLQELKTENELNKLG